MKKSIGVILGLLLSVSVLAGEKELVVRVSNPLNQERPSELVIVKWSALQQKLPALTAKAVAVFEKNGTYPLISQVIDYNQDGKPEELVFRTGFKARETKEFVVREHAGGVQPTASLTDARFVTPREDLAWENDRIAFRMYGPALAKEVNNGIDVWTKRVRSLIVKKWYAGEEQQPKISYHEDHGEGADYFSVGRTLGVGASSLVKGDSLYQPGVFQKYRIIATGPLVAMFELTYAPVVFEGKNITQVVRISLAAGVNLNRIETTFSSGSTKGKVPFAVGIVKRKGTIAMTAKKSGWIALWGLTTDKEEVGYLGTGLVMAKTTMKQTKEDNVHALILGVAEFGKPVTYYAGAGWTLSGDFTTADSWRAYLSGFSQKIDSPLNVKVSIK
jgi:pectinesterase